MPIGDLSGKIAPEDLERMRDKKHPPEYEPGYDGSSGGGDEWGGLDSVFDDDGDSFGGGSDSGDSFGGGSFGGGSFGGGSFGGGSFGGDSLPGLGATPGGFGSTQFGAGGMPGTSTFGQSFMGGGFGNPMGQQPQQQQAEPDAFDKICAAAEDGGAAIIRVLVAMIKSFGTRNYDDWARYGKNMVYAGAVSMGLGVACILLWIMTHASVFEVMRLPAYFFLTGALTGVIGAIVIVACAAMIVKNADKYSMDSKDLGEIPPDGDLSNNEVENALSQMFGGGDEDDLYGSDDDDSGWGGFGDSEDTSEEDEGLGERSDFFGDFSKAEEPEPEKAVDPDAIFDKHMQSIGRAPVITREVLFNTFKPMLPTNTVEFSTRNEIDSDSDKFLSLEAICLKAIAAVMGKEKFDEVPAKLESAVETLYTYELKIKRVPGLRKTEEIGKEITAYMKSSVNDSDVSCKVDIEGDYYVAIATKGVSEVITFGDVFTLQSACDFYLNTKNLLPMCAGIKLNGEPVLVDAKLFDTMLIAGRPRSGKSWYVLSIIMSLAMFNSPEDVQFLIIDPKKSNLMNTLHLLPHVCGVVDDSNILPVLDGVIEGEAERRKKLLADNRCDKLFDLWDLGIKVPVLYIVIDEYMTVLANLSEGADKDFKEKIKVIISQLPSLGIRLIIVPHRSKGVVDVTARTNISFSAAVRAEPSVIKETLDIQKWDTPLLNPGDTALKMQGFGDPVMVSGVALTTSDMQNSKFIENVAKIFYQMGVDIPDMSGIGPGNTRNDDEILKELRAERDTKHVQQDIDSLPGGEDDDWG